MNRGLLLFAVSVLSAWPAIGPVKPARSDQAPSPLAWPPVTSETKPWAYWWWMGSAVNREDLTRNLEQLSAAGIGGVHVIPIYGARGYEAEYLEYLSPKWLGMLRHAVEEARRLGMGVDMTTGTGWCFGGPNISDALANATVVLTTEKLESGAPVGAKDLPPDAQAVVAFEHRGKAVELTGRVGRDGSIDWTVPEGSWELYVVSQRPSGRMVKRAAPGGEGPMLNPFYGEAIRRYLRRFDEAFRGYDGPMVRAMYHDSYEYRSDWSPDLFDEFQRRRGYRLQTELPTLFGRGPADRVGRVKCDYRETISDLMIEHFMGTWVGWAHEKGCRTRNQAHGSPGNLLDLYAAADIPETEMFRDDRDPLVSKFASSAAHVAGRKLVAAETGTWLGDHFTVTLAKLKRLVDELFLSGVNHVIYHGTCYSPGDAPWPGWVFYAATQMNPRNAIWRDAPTLNAYIARCQSILQAGGPGGDVLVYWPIHDLWSDPQGMVQSMTVHRRGWLHDQPIGRTAEQLWDRGYAFDYVSDRQLHATRIEGDRIRTPGAGYRAIVVPACRRIPVGSLRRLIALADGGATVIFEDRFPSDVPGLGRLDARRAELRGLLAAVTPATRGTGVARSAVGRGRILVGPLAAALAAAGIDREPMVDRSGLRCIRRTHAAGYHYFIANLGDRPADGWVRLATHAASVVAMDPMTGRAGVASSRPSGRGVQVRLTLAPGGSILLRTFTERRVDGPPWKDVRPVGEPVELSGRWRVAFVQGGPELPAAFQTDRLASWTALGGDEARRFAGTARYTLRFDSPGVEAEAWLLDLGRVAETVRVRFNGRDFGTRITAPFRVRIEGLRPSGNVLEVEVTNLSANRVRDLDRRKVAWKIFHDINFVSIGYKPFDASGWPIRESGLIGPVRLIPARIAGKRID